MIKVREVIVCEGRYDKDTLSQVFDAVIIETGGFQVFNDREKLALLRALAAARGLVILTDSDGAGFQIRGYLKGAIDPALVKHAYIPEIFGKESRKRMASKEGKLGVEGMKPDVLREALRRAGATILDGEVQQGSSPSGPPIKKADLYALGLSGKPGSEHLREQVLHMLGLPSHLSANALIEFLNTVSNRDALAILVEEIRKKS